MVIIGNPRSDDSLVYLPSGEFERNHGFLRMEYGLKRSFSRDIYIQEVGIWQRGKICLSPNHCLKFLTPKCRRYMAEILSIRRETRSNQSIYQSSAVCIGTPLKVFPYLNESIREFRAFLNESNFKMFPVRINFFFVKIRNKSITKKLSGKP